MKKVFITYKLPGSPEKILQKHGFRISIHSGNKPITRKDLLNKGKDADAVITLLTDKIDREVIDAFQKCKIIANCAVGYNNLDVEYARSKKIIVTNTPDILTDATADLTAALILACARRFHEGEAIMRANQFKGWKPDMLLGMELKRKIVGIVGAGRIGQATAKRLKAFGTGIIYFDRNKREDFENETGAEKVSLNFLLKNSDIISVHLPLSKNTFHLLDETNLKLIKPTSVIVNTSRGEVIDEKSLVNLLKKKKIFAAGLDVYEGEPKINHELLKLENVFLLPHLGSATTETRSAMAYLCAQNVINVLKGKAPLTPV